MSAQVNVPFSTPIAGFIFNVNSLIAIDTGGYEQGAEGREIHLYLVGPHVRTFSNAAADEAHAWYLRFTGQAHIELAIPPMMRPGSA